MKTAAVIGHKATDKKWDVPGKIANRKGRPEPKKKKTAAADETSERRKSIVSQKKLEIVEDGGKEEHRTHVESFMSASCYPYLRTLCLILINRSAKSGSSRNVHQTASREATSF